MNYSKLFSLKPLTFASLLASSTQYLPDVYRGEKMQSLLILKVNIANSD